MDIILFITISNLKITNSFMAIGFFCVCSVSRWLKIRNHIKMIDQHFHNKAIDGKECDTLYPNESKRIPTFKFKQISRIEPYRLYGTPQSDIRQCQR